MVEAEAALALTGALVLAAVLVVDDAAALLVLALVVEVEGARGFLVVAAFFLVAVVDAAFYGDRGRRRG